MLRFMIETSTFPPPVSISLIIRIALGDKDTDFRIHSSVMITDSHGASETMLFSPIFTAHDPPQTISVLICRTVQTKGADAQPLMPCGIQLGGTHL